MEKSAAPPRIQKGSFFDKIVKEGRQECHLCKICIETGKGNEPLQNGEGDEVEQFEEKWKKYQVRYFFDKPEGKNWDEKVDKYATLDWYQEAKKELEPYLQKLDIVEKSHQQYSMNFYYQWEKKLVKNRGDDEEWMDEVDKRMVYIFGKPLREINDEELARYDIEVNSMRIMTFYFREDRKGALQAYLRALESKINKLTGKDIPPLNDKDKPNDKDRPNDKNQEHNEYPCEKCQTSTYDKEKGSYIRRRITHYYTDFTKKVWYFGMNCPCAEQFKKENQQSCSHCNKTEWPDMKKGWMLDYEIKKSFCSPDCHVKYRNLSWEQADQLTQIEMMPPELDISNSNNQSDFNWEREGMMREVLYWRESVRELQKQLEESKKKSPNQRHPNEIPHQQRQISYLLNLHRNTQQKAEKAYKNKYGELKESNFNDNKNKGMSGGIIALLVIGVVAVVGGLIYFLTRRKSKK